MRPIRSFIPFIKSPPLVAVIRLQGAIGAAGQLGTGLNDATLEPLIERAFKRGKPVAVALAINSPGGSAAQSSLIAGRVRRLADEKGVKVHAFVEDVAASGGYWLACAADDIWLDPTSIVGSVGVISAGFGLHELFGRYGVDPSVTEANTIDRIYQEVPCYSPLPSLAVHFQHFDTLSPYFDWQKWWDASAV